MRVALICENDRKPSNVYAIADIEVVNVYDSFRGHNSIN